MRKNLSMLIIELQRHTIQGKWGCEGNGERKKEVILTQKIKLVQTGKISYPDYVSQPSNVM